MYEQIKTARGFVLTVLFSGPENTMPCNSKLVMQLEFFWHLKLNLNYFTIVSSYFHLDGTQTTFL